MWKGMCTGMCVSQKTCGTACEGRMSRQSQELPASHLSLDKNRLSESAKVGAPVGLRKLVRGDF